MTKISPSQDFGYHDPVSADDVAELRPSLNDYTQRSRYAEVVAIRHALLARQQRGRFFNPELFADPAWDMLLELYAACLTERRMTVSRLTERAGVPMTTALRWIRVLEREELIDREKDRLDGRRIFLSLTNKGRIAMSRYFEDLHPDAKIF